MFNAYEFPGSVTGPYASLTILPNGDIRIEIAHVSWAYEVLMNRWLMEKQIASHQPYLENLTMNAQLNSRQANLTLDAICQYSLHAVKANKSAGTGPAWVFEPIREDYLPASIEHPNSDFQKYVGLYYQSWNAGDPWFNTPNAYDSTPGWFNLTKSESLVIELPKHDVIGYEAKVMAVHAIDNITYGGYPYGGDFSDYINIKHHGPISLGFYVTNLIPGSGPTEQPLDLNSMYDPLNKTLTINGPHNFDNSGFGAGMPMYHGAPWIEFNVTYPGSTVLAESSPPSASVGHAASASESVMMSEIAGFVAMISATLAGLVMLAVGLRRMRAC
jgi:hypothetical protein